MANPTTLQTKAVPVIHRILDLLSRAISFRLTDTIDGRISLIPEWVKWKQELVELPIVVDPMKEARPLANSVDVLIYKTFHLLLVDFFLPNAPSFPVLRQWTGRLKELLTLIDPSEAVEIHPRPKKFLSYKQWRKQQTKTTTSSIHDVHLHMFLRTYQRSSESLDDWSLRLQYKFYLAFPALSPENSYIIMDQFILGFCDHRAADYIWHKTPSNLAEALRVAHEWTLAKRIHFFSLPNEVQSCSETPTDVGSDTEDDDNISDLSEMDYDQITKFHLELERTSEGPSSSTGTNVPNNSPSDDTIQEESNSKDTIPHPSPFSMLEETRDSLLHPCPIQYRTPIFPKPEDRPSPFSLQQALKGTPASCPTTTLPQ